MKALSKTAAIRETANAISITGRGTSWQVIGPHNFDNMRSPSTTINTTSYTKARTVATKWRAQIALHMMGLLSDNVIWAVEEHDAWRGGGRLVDYIATGIEAAKL